MVKKNLVKTCIGIRSENMERLDKLQSGTGFCQE